MVTKKILLGLLIIAACIKPVGFSSAQAPDGFHCSGRPLGDFIVESWEAAPTYEAGGIIFGTGVDRIPAFGPRKSLIYVFSTVATPGLYTIHVFDSLVATASIFPEGTLEVIGTAIRYNGPVETESIIFHSSSWGAPHTALKKCNISESGKYTIEAMVGSTLYGLRSGGGNYGFGVFFRINTDGSEYTELYHFQGVYERPEHLMLRYEFNSDGTPNLNNPVEFWGIAYAGGNHGKGALLVLSLDGSEVYTRLDFTGQGGANDTWGPTDGEGPVGLVQDIDTDAYVITKSGGLHNNGAIYLIGFDGVYKVHDFTEQYGTPTGTVSIDRASKKMFGLSGGTPANSGYIWMQELIGDHTFNEHLVDFSTTPYKNPIAIGAVATGELFLTVEGGVSPTGNGAFIKLNQNGSGISEIQPFEDCYAHLIDPPDNATNVSITPRLEAYGSSTRTTFILSTSTDFLDDTVMYTVRNEASYQVTEPLKYGTTYYARVDTDVSFEGDVTKFTTAPAENYTFLTVPRDGAVNVSTQNLEVTANLVNGATYYRIELNTKANFTGTSLVRNSSFPGQRTMTFNNLQKGKTYYTRVRTNLSSSYGPVGSFQTPPQKIGNQPAGNVVSAPDGFIYGSFSRKNSSGLKTSLIYKYQPGAATPDPVFQSDTYELNIYAADSSGIYGIALTYNGDSPASSFVFRLNTDGTGFKVVRIGTVSAFGNPKILAIAENTLYGSHDKGGKYGGGLLFTINTDGSNYKVVGSFLEASQIPHYMTVFTVPGTTTPYLVSLRTFPEGQGVASRHALNGSIVGQLLYFVGPDGVNPHPPTPSVDGLYPTGTLMTSPDRSEVYVTRGGGANNKGAIFYSDGKAFDFTNEYGEPYGNLVNNHFEIFSFFGLGGNFETNTGFLYSFGLANGFSIVSTFGKTAPVRIPVSFVLAADNRLYGSAEMSSQDDENGAFFSVNADGSDLRMIFPFIDGYTQVKTPDNNALDVSLTPDVKLFSLPGVSTYTLQISKTPDFSSEVQTFTMHSPNIKLPRLNYSTTYYTRVKTNLISNDYGKVTQFTTYPPEKYSVVSSPVDHAVNVATDNLKVTANILYGATIYTVELNTSPDFTGTSIVLSSPTPNHRTMTFNDLEPGTTYYNRVRTNFPSDWGPARSFTTATPPPPSALSGEQVQQVKISPNPFEKEFTVDVQSEGEKTSLVLLDVTGRELTTVDVASGSSVKLGNGLSQGVYILQLKTGSKTTVHRVVKK